LGYRKIGQPKNSAENKTVGKKATQINVINNGNVKKERKKWQPENSATKNGPVQKRQHKVTVRRNGNGSLGNREIGNHRLPHTNHKLASSHALAPGNYHSCRKPRFKLLFFGFLSQMNLDNFATARRSSSCHRFFTVHPLPIFLLPIFSLPFFSVA